MSSLIYTTWVSADGSGNGWNSGADSDFKVMLVKSGYTPDLSHLHPNATGLASNEVSGAGYARQNVASRTRTANGGLFDYGANNPTFTAVSSSLVRYVVIYKVVTSDSDHVLVCCLDLGSGTTYLGDVVPLFNGGASSGTVYTGP